MLTHHCVGIFMCSVDTKSPTCRDSFSAAPAAISKTASTGAGDFHVGSAWTVLSAGGKDRSMPITIPLRIQSRSMEICIPFIQNVAVLGSEKGKYMPSVREREPTPPRPSLCSSGVLAMRTVNVCPPTATWGWGRGFGCVWCQIRQLPRLIISRQSKESGSVWYRDGWGMWERM